MKVIVWALQIAVSENWSSLVWSSNARALVQEINSNLDPCEEHEVFDFTLQRVILL